ncbi:hypothetical protein G6F59_017282 [Rhizopus arrhizus]|nr:hypothetical protein G6F59_017282 [Rhizopus arrhizus]
MLALLPSALPEAAIDAAGAPAGVEAEGVLRGCGPLQHAVLVADDGMGEARRDVPLLADAALGLDFPPLHLVALAGGSVGLAAIGQRVHRH